MTELIFRYVGSEADADAAVRAALPDARVAFLLNQYGIIRLEEDQIEAFRDLECLVYIEAAQALYYSSLHPQTNIDSPRDSSESSFQMDFPESSFGNSLDFLTLALTSSDLDDAYYNLSAACFPSGEERTYLNGQGVLLCVIDSGIDYRHPEFLTADGRTRILAYWDQSTNIVYSEADINEALTAGTLQGSRLVPATDISGHGTAVASVCGGSNIGAAPGASLLVVKLGNPITGGFPRTSELMQGIDFCVRESILLGMPAVVNLSFGNSYGSHQGTSLLETYIDSLDGVGKTVFVTGTGNEGTAGGHKTVRFESSGIRNAGTDFRTKFSSPPGQFSTYQGRMYNQNLNQNSSHDSTQNLTHDSVQNFNQNINGNNLSETIQLSVAESTPNLNIQVWKNYADVMEIRLIAPTGESFLFHEGTSGSFITSTDVVDIYTFGNTYTDFSPDSIPSISKPASSGSDGISAAIPNNLSSDDQTTDSFGTRINYVYHLPSYYQSAQELYLSLEPDGSSWYIMPGIWQIVLTPIRVTDGTVHLWLPGESARGPFTAFLDPTPFGTFTIPSTASKIISVGAYRAADDSYADFSGRGFEDFLPRTCKPDLVAPGTDVLCAMPGGGYLTQSGTSLAAPFVSGASALLMQWGIVAENDPYLYGEKVKAYLKRGAKTLPAFREYPNPYVGYGKLCVRESLP